MDQTMSRRWRAEELPEPMRRQIATNPWGRGFSPQAPPEKPQKYRNRVTFVNGIRFHSRLEADHYGDLKTLRAGGAVKCFLRQIGFDLPGGARHLVDWLVILPDDRSLFAESKGSDLPMGRLKRRQVEELYGVRIRLWGKSGVDIAP